MAANLWLFTATDPTYGTELWVTGGTPATTRLLKDIWSGVSSSQPSQLTDLSNGLMVFAATGDNNNTGRELWVTDGTTAGTKMLVDLYPGATGSSPSNFIRLATGKVLFSASGNGTNGNLWTTDGTVAGTKLVENIFGPNNGTDLRQFTPFGAGKAIFTALDFGSGMGNVMWITDGTAAGSFMLKSFGNYATPTAFTDLGNGKMLFTGTDGTNGAELWVTNGTTVGTTLVKDINPGAANSFSSFSEPKMYALGNGRAVFRANDGVHGDELWTTDGTAAGTKLLVDISAGSGGGNPANIFKMATGKVLFAATDGTSYGELWITNGTVAGTTLLKDFAVGVNGAPSDFFRLPNGKVLFSGQTTTNGRELWITDGTVAGTTMVKDIAAGSASSTPNGFALLKNGRAVFSADGELWVSDGTAAGTNLVVDLTPGFNNSTNPTSFKSLGDGRATFVRNVDAVNGPELWVTDGTAAGTKLLKDINPGAGTSSPSMPTMLQKIFYINGTAGNDTLTGSMNADVINGLDGNDRINGNGQSDTLIGGAGADVLNGWAAADVLRGGLGQDTLSGGTGADSFVFDTAPERDTITDFSHTELDLIKFSKAVFTGFTHTGALLADEFYAAAGATQAHDASDRIIYNTTTGVLYYDADGINGASAVEIALMGSTTHPALVNTDFMIIA